MELYTGPYRYKDLGKDSIDTVKKYQMADMKMFKQAKGTETEWLTKSRKVRQEMETVKPTKANGRDT